MKGIAERKMQWWNLQSLIYGSSSIPNSSLPLKQQYMNHSSFPIWCVRKRKFVQKRCNTVDTDIRCNTKTKTYIPLRLLPKQHSVYKANGPHTCTILHPDSINCFNTLINISFYSSKVSLSYLQDYRYQLI